MKKYRYGMNDKYGHLVEIIVPAENLQSAWDMINEFIKGTEFAKEWVWINDITEY